MPSNERRDVTGSDHEAAREEVLAATVRTYAGYVESGHADRWSSRPGNLLAAAEREAWLVTALGPCRGGTILDLGCGTGFLALVLDAAGKRPARYVGVDLLDERIAEAARRAPWGEFHVSSADRLPLEDGSVDAVAAIVLFSSLMDAWFRTAVGREIARVLKPDGRVVVYDLRYPSPRNRHVVPIRRTTLAAMFPGWAIEARTMTLLPPLARSPLGSGPRRYRFLASIPALRSHIAAIVRRTP